MTQIMAPPTSDFVRLRIEYIEAGNYSLGELADITASLVPLLTVLELDQETVALLNERFVHGAESNEFRGSLETSVSLILATRRYAVSQTRIVSISKSSPMVIILEIGAGVEVAYSVINRWYRLRERHRKQKDLDAASRLRQSAVNLVYEHIRRLGAREDVIENGTEVGKLLGLAGTALSLVASIDEVDPHKLHKTP